MAQWLIKGLGCGICVENIEEPLMRGIRYPDKLIDALARGKAMHEILRDRSSFRDCFVALLYDGEFK